MNIRHGYFLPLQGKMCGDPEFAAEAKKIYDSLGFSKYKFAGRYDGVSIFQREDVAVIKRIVLQNFFSEELKCLIQDLP